MNVELINCQEYALELLIYTKSTRLQGNMTLQDIETKPYDWKMEQLEYMRETIQSSWEFAHYIFEISGVSRAFTHQLVRTRTASFAQESHRASDLSDFDYFIPPSIQGGFGEMIYYKVMDDSRASYKQLIDVGVPRQDARGVIPTNALTNIIMGVNLRTLHDMAELRLCVRTQGEYQKVFKEMKMRVVEVHPWARDFMEVFCVNHGTCCFPNYKECPIQKHTIQGENLRRIKGALKYKHANLDFEANPIAKDGRTM